MKKFNFNYVKKAKELSITKKDIKILKLKNHIIGLHSHTHPTNIEKFNFKSQYNEYYLNKKILQKYIKMIFFVHLIPQVNLIITQRKF